MYLGPYQRPAQLHSATAQQSPQGSSMKGLCAVVGIGTTAVLHSALNIHIEIRMEYNGKVQSHSAHNTPPPPL